MNKQSTSQFSMQLLARQMAVAGYVTRITRIHTGLSYKQILKIYSDLEDEGVRCEKRARIPKTGTSLIRNVTSLIQGSLLMQFYYSLAGDEIYKSVDLNLLNQAFQLYLSIREEFGYITDPRWKPSIFPMLGASPMSYAVHKPTWNTAPLASAITSAPKTSARILTAPSASHCRTHDSARRVRSEASCPTA